MLALIGIILSGCTEVEKFWDKEFVGVYAKGHQQDKDKARLTESLNFFLGKSKDERIRIIGKPDACTPVNTGGEICEWTPKASSAQAQHIVYGFDRDGIATGWRYRGPLGDFTSADSMGTAAPTSSAQPVQPKKAWTHPAKHIDESSKEFSQDYFECQNKLAHDPKAQSSMAMYVEYGIENCLREKGWTNH